MISVHIEADNPTELADALAELHIRGLVVSVENPNTPTDPPPAATTDALPDRYRQRRHLTAVPEGATA